MTDTATRQPCAIPPLIALGAVLLMACNAPSPTVPAAEPAAEQMDARPADAFVDPPPVDATLEEIAAREALAQAAETARVEEFWTLLSGAEQDLKGLGKVGSRAIMKRWRGDLDALSEAIRARDVVGAARAAGRGFAESFAYRSQVLKRAMDDFNADKTRRLDRTLREVKMAKAIGEVHESIVQYLLAAPISLRRTMFDGLTTAHKAGGDKGTAFMLHQLSRRERDPSLREHMKSTVAGLRPAKAL